MHRVFGGAVTLFVFVVDLYVHLLTTLLRHHTGKKAKKQEKTRKYISYTGIYPFYKDFGLIGVACFAIILGLLFGYLFKSSEDGSEFAFVIYTILSGVLIMSFVGDTFFTILSQNIQYFIAAMIPYIISKYNLFSNLIKRNG
mgnify:CR=1 FL=1